MKSKKRCGPNKPTIRRSLSNIPKDINSRNHLYDPNALRFDNLGNSVQIIERPVRRKDRYPSYEKFLNGRSHIWSVAYAISKHEQSKRDMNSKLGQTCDGGWFMKDQKDHIMEQNKENQKQRSLPESLSIHLRICRTQVVALLSDDFESIRFKDLPHIFVFFKTSASGSTNISKNNMPIEVKTSKVTLKNSTVLFWVGGHSMVGISQSSGLGTLYIGSGGTLNGRAQLLLRVKQRQKEAKKKREEEMAQ